MIAILRIVFSRNCFLLFESKLLAHLLFRADELVSSLNTSKTCDTVSEPY